jgi:hypothetical protein
MLRTSFASAAIFLALLAARVDAQDPNYVLSIGGGPVGVGGTLTSIASIDTSTGQPLQGWSYGVCHDPAALELLNADAGETTNTVNGGDPAAFLNVAEFSGGYTLGVVVNLFGAAVLPPGSGYELSLGTYSNLMAQDATTDLCPCDSLGTPPVATVVVVGGASIEPTQACGTATSVGATPFVRGDANDDSQLNIADGVWILNDLFQGGPSTDCLGANDSNASGSVDAADAIFVFNFQFLDGPAPSAPFPNCGGEADPTPEDCASYTSCP